MGVFRACLKKINPEEIWKILTDLTKNKIIAGDGFAKAIRILERRFPEERVHTKQFEILCKRSQETIENTYMWSKNIRLETKQNFLSMVRELCGRYQEKITGSKSPHKHKCESSGDDQTSEKRQRESENDSETSEKRQRESENDSETSEKRQRESENYSETSLKRQRESSDHSE